MAEKHDFVLTRAEIEKMVSGRTLGTWCARGHVHRVAPGVFAFVETLTWDQKLRAYAKSSPDLVVSHRSALRMYEVNPILVRQFDFVTTVDTTKGLPDAAVRQSNCLVVEHCQMLDGLRVTSPARSLFDVSGIWGPDLIRRAFESALDKRLTTVAEMRRMTQELRCRGRSRVAFLDMILDDPRWDDPKNRSALERDARARLVAAGLPAPVAQHAIPLEHFTLHPDLCYPDAGLAIELDGWGSHSTRRSFHDDRRRDAELAIKGWEVLRFSADTMHLVAQAVASRMAA